MRAGNWLLRIYITLGALIVLGFKPNAATSLLTFDAAETLLRNLTRGFITITVSMAGVFYSYHNLASDGKLEASITSDLPSCISSIDQDPQQAHALIASCYLAI
jgi:hypothetical protein